MTAPRLVIAGGPRTAQLAHQLTDEEWTALLGPGSGPIPIKFPPGVDPAATCYDLVAYLDSIEPDEETPIGRAATKRREQRAQRERGERADGTADIAHHRARSRGRT